MREKSPSTRHLDAFVHRLSGEVLRPAGFTRLGRTFRRASADVVQGVHVQASKWNTTEEASFTINLLVVWPSWHEIWTGAPCPVNPASAAPVVELRIGSVLPEQTDRWWTVRPGEPLEPGLTEVRQILTVFALPALAEFRSVEHLVAALDRDGLLPGLVAPDLVRAALFLQVGRRDDALASLEAARAKAPGWSAVDRVAARLGLAGAA